MYNGVEWESSTPLIAHKLPSSLVSQTADHALTLNRSPAQSVGFLLKEKQTKNSETKSSKIKNLDCIAPLSDNPTGGLRLLPALGLSHIQPVTRVQTSPSDQVMDTGSSKATVPGEVRG